MRAPFPFIVGCGRSGTTLVRAILEGHPEVTVVHESRFIPSMLEHRARHERNGGIDVERFLDELFSRRTVASRIDTWRLTADDLRGALGAASPGDVPSAIRVLYGAYAAKRGKSRYGDKTPGYMRSMDVIGQAFPEARFVHVVRDGRDVALALRDVDFGPANLVHAAHAWRKKVLNARGTGAALGPERYMELRYEQLVGDPETTVRALCSFLELDFAPEMLELREGPAGTARLDGLGRQQHHSSLALPITPGLRDWRAQMDPADVRRYERVAADALAELGYEVTEHRATGPGHWAATTAGVARGRMVAYRRARRRSRSGGR